MFVFYSMNVAKNVRLTLSVWKLVQTETGIGYQSRLRLKEPWQSDKNGNWVWSCKGNVMEWNLFNQSINQSEHEINSYFMETNLLPSAFNYTVVDDYEPLSMSTLWDIKNKNVFIMCKCNNLDEMEFILFILIHIKNE